MTCCGAYMGAYCTGCPHYDPELTGRCHRCWEPRPNHDEDCPLWTDAEEDS